MVLQLWQRLDCMYFLHRAGDRKREPFSKHIPTPIFSTPCPVFCLSHKQHVPFPLVSPKSQDSCCLHVDMDKLQKKTGDSPISTALPQSAIVCEDGSNNWVSLASGFLLPRLELFRKGYPACTLEWTQNLIAHHCVDTRRRLTNDRGNSHWKSERELPRPTGTWVHFLSAYPFVTQIYPSRCEWLVFPNMDTFCYLKCTWDGYVQFWNSSFVCLRNLLPMKTFFQAHWLFCFLQYF